MVDFLDAFPMRIGGLIRDGYELELRRAPWAYEVEYRVCAAFPIVYQPFLLASQWLGAAVLRQAAAVRYQGRWRLVTQPMSASIPTANPARSSTATNAASWWKVRDWKRMK